MLYLDNDTLITLAELNLLDLLCPALGEDHEDFNLFCLRTCLDFVEDEVAEPVRSVVLKFLERVGPVSGHLHGTELAELRAIERVDLEAELFACCANDPGAKVVTGDLKAIRALAAHASQETRDKLRGRVRCTEQCLIAIIDHAGFATVSSRWQASNCDHEFFEQLVGKTEPKVRQLIADRIQGCSSNMKLLLAMSL